MEKNNIVIMPIKKMYMTLQENCPKNAIVIACSSYPVDESKLTIPHIVEMFDDLDREVPGRSISNMAVNRIGLFLQEHEQKTEQILVACDSGESRSSAIAAAICRHFGLDDTHIWNNPHYHPNPLVFLKVCHRLNVPMSDETVDYLVEMNYRAFHKAVKRE